MALCLKHTVYTLYRPGNILFQVIGQVYASSAVLQINTDIQKVWRYDSLQWHNVTIKHPENR
jgi:hypothetical protein